MAKKKIVFDEKERKTFLIQSKKGKYTKKQKEEYVKKLLIKESRQAKREKHKIYKNRVNEKFQEINDKLKEMDHYLNEEESEESGNK